MALAGREIIWEAGKQERARSPPLYWTEPRGAGG